MKHILFTLFLSIIICDAHAQIVTIPDVNFKNVLLNDPSINTNADTEIQVSEAQVTLDLFFYYEAIIDFTGLEAFVNLQSLTIEGELATTIDLSANLSLTNLSIVVTPIEILDLSNNTQLQTLELVANELSALDLSANLQLGYIYFFNNPVTDLNLGTNTALEELIVSSNVILPTIDVSGNTSLTKIEVVNNSMTSFDVSNNLNLEILRTYGNNLLELDVSNNLMLKELNTMFNQISSLDLSANIHLDWFNARNNQLETLDARNGNNDLFINFNVLNNPNLDCILVDDPTAPYLLSWSVDQDTLFGSTTQNCQPLVLDDNEVLSQYYYPNPVQKTLFIESTNPLVELYVYSSSGAILIKQTPSQPTLLYQIDLSSLTTGVYYLKTVTTSSRGIKKIVKY